MVQKNKVKCIFDTSKENGCCIKINLASELSMTALKTFVLSQLHRHTAGTKKNLHLFFKYKDNLIICVSLTKRVAHTTCRHLIISSSLYYFFNS